MAVARAPVGGGMSGIKVALIVFVCLTVASLAFTVVLYTRQSDLQASADDAAKRVQQANADKSKMQDEVSAVARAVSGESTNEAEKIQAAVKSIVDPIVKDPALAKARIAPDASVASVLKGLYSEYKNTATLLAETAAKNEELNKQLAKANEDAQKAATDFNAKMTEYQQRITALEAANKTNQDAWADQIDKLKSRLEEANTKAASALSGIRTDYQKLEQQLKQSNQHATELAEKLSKFQPGHDITPEQIADGTVVRSIPYDNIVYIGLGKRDRITPGMTFTVYSASRPGSTSREKGMLQVANVFETNSECRVTASKPNDPIVEGDLVSNLVYDKNRTYRFVVAGDFDLDFDNKIDTPGGAGGQEVAGMIKRWGGQVVDHLDTSVDFVVLGTPPAAPAPLPAGATDEAKARAGAQLKTRQAFEAIQNEAKSLSIPVLTRTQFLHFIGITVPQHAEDRLASQ